MSKNDHKRRTETQEHLCRPVGGEELATVSVNRPFTDVRSEELRRRWEAGVRGRGLRGVCWFLSVFVLK